MVVVQYHPRLLFLPLLDVVVGGCVLPSPAAHPDIIAFGSERLYPHLPLMLLVSNIGLPGVQSLT